jgi:UDP-N-acetylglucosamine diphosphorylase/glucosamine-1-phosphate N-acetyltransferase
MQISFFYDSGADRLHPLALTRPVDFFRVGIFRIHEKWIRLLRPRSVSRLVPDYLKDLYAADELTDEPCLWINSRLLPDFDLQHHISSMKIGEGLQHNGVPLLCLHDGMKSRKWFDAGMPGFEGVSFSELENPLLLRYTWDVLLHNPEQIVFDLDLYGISAKPGPLPPGVFCDRPDQLFMEDSAIVEPGVTFITSEGPVYLGKNAFVQAGSMIRGPVAIGDNATVRMGTRLYGDASIGPYCKVGGELKSVVMFSYSNKAHDGYLGNSVIGRWCNIGADTNSSNLKNNYSMIRVQDYMTGEDIDTGLQFLGMIMGDHCMTAINSMINSGSQIGVMTNLFGSYFPPKLVKCFRWVGQEKIDMYTFDKAMESASRMMARRDVELTPEYEKMLRYIHDNFCRE